MRILVAILALILLLPLITSAQSLGDSTAKSTPFTVSVGPQYPAPYGEATLSFLSSTLDLTNATITVSVGGKQIYKGSVQPVTLTLGKAGSVTNVLVLLSSGGTTYGQRAVIQPQDVVLIAEPISSAPALYKGKPSVPLEGDTRIVAVANLKDATGKTIDPATLSYAWTVDDTQIANSSGIGKSVIMVASPLQYRSRTVSVVVQSQSGSLVGGAKLTLAPKEPSVRIYESDPLLGIRFDRALAGQYAIAAESTLFAVPFSFARANGGPRIQWFLNGEAAQTGSSITLRPSGSGQGTAALSLTVSKGAAIEALANLSLSFGTKPSTNFFGL